MYNIADKQLCANYYNEFFLFLQICASTLQRSVTRLISRNASTSNGYSFGMKIDFIITSTQDLDNERLVYFITELNETQQEMQDLARKFAREEIIPAAPKYDRSGEYPWEIIKKAWSVGLLNRSIPQDIGKENNKVL